MKGIICPHCKHEHENWQDYIEDTEGKFTIDCEECGEEFQVKFTATITFETK